MIMYSNDDKGKFYGLTDDHGSPAVGANDSLYVLHPSKLPMVGITNLPIGTPIYVSDYKTFICPSTSNQVDDPSDLRHFAIGPSDGSGAYSYEPRLTMESGFVFPDGFKVPAANPGFGTKCLKSQKNCPRATENLCLTDADNDQPAYTTDINNWPDPSNNHGAQGWNMGYLDGHVSFTLTGKAILEGFMGGHYVTSIGGGGVSEDQIINRYGLYRSGNVYQWR